MEVRYNPSQVLEGRVHKYRYLHSPVSSKDNLIKHVGVFILGRIVHRGVVDGFWLMDFSWHRFNVITVAELAILVNVVLTVTQS